MDVDYIIVGQGICGSFLSYYLRREGKKVFVIDQSMPNTASKVASGVINPVTGRRVVKSWRIDTFLPFAMEAYQQIAEDMKIGSFIQNIRVLDIHGSEQMRLAFNNRIHNEDSSYVKDFPNIGSMDDYFISDFGLALIEPAILIDLESFLGNWRHFLQRTQLLREELFQPDSLQLTDEGIIYQDIHANKILFCDGINVMQNPYFKGLPFAFNKGEALIVEIKDLPREYIYKLGLSLVPWKNKDLFWVGSNYQWTFTDDLQTQTFFEDAQAILQSKLKIPFNIIDHIAGVRPANKERRPFVGMHPLFPQIGILNGMGTKGCSLTPFFAKQLSDSLINGGLLDPEVDIQRCWDKENGDWKKY